MGVYAVRGFKVTIIMPNNTVRVNARRTGQYGGNY
jgi:hypothetical protein